MYIDGCWCEASDGATFDLANPATGETIAALPAATVEDLDRALRSSQQGFEVWRATPAPQRAEILRAVGELIRSRADTIAAIMTEEQGKPLAEARTEAFQAADYFTWYGEEARRLYGRVIPGRQPGERLEVLRYPVGPVAAFTAWNFPASLPARKLAPALAAGCSIILKPAGEAPRTAMCLVQACHDAGVPPGAVNLVTGRASMISTHLCGSGVIRKITLTGSVPVGQELVRLSARHVVPLSLELGGHAPVLVFPDADAAQAAEACVRAKFRNCGQVCISPSRFFVHDAIHDGFCEAFVAATRRLVVGLPTDAAVDIGPLASRKRLEAVEHLVSDAVHKGATVQTGGQRCPALPGGWFYEPTVLTELTDAMELLTEEPFGPIAPILRFHDTADAIAQANATPYGLAAYVFTDSLGELGAAVDGIEAGMVGVNHFGLATAEAPFGGTKLSGYGREGGIEGLDGYTYAKYVSTRA